MKKNVFAMLMSITLIIAAAVSATGSAIDVDTATTAASPAPVDAATPSPSPSAAAEPSTGAIAKPEGRYLTFRGTIESIAANATGLSITVKSSSEVVIVYHIYDETLIFDLKTREAVKKDSLKEGLDVSAFYGVNTPAAMSEPPQINPEGIVIHEKDSAGKLKAEHFDQDGLSADGSLKLNISNETVVVNIRGEDLKADDAKNKNLLVFYTDETKSIPPQTSPEKIVVLEGAQIEASAETQAEASAETPASEVQAETQAEAQASEEASAEAKTWGELLTALSPDAIHRSEQATFVRLRDLSSHLDFELEWDDASKTVTLIKGNETCLLTIGQAEFTHNQTTEKLQYPTFILGDRTFVEEDFILRLFGE